MELLDFKEKIDLKQLEKVANCIKKGKLVVFPTETVYGIGTNAFDEMAVSNIFKAKGRPSDNPLIVHIANFKMLDELVTNVNEVEKKLMKAFWPGPLTIILPKKDVLPQNVTCGLDTVGIRMPNNDIALKLIKMANVPIAAPSANVSGKPSGTTIEDIYLELKDKVEYMIDSSITNIGVESTVVKIIDNEVVILRPGKISPDDIKKVGVNVKLHDHLFKNININDRVESPGMKHRHYAPSTKTILVDGVDNEKTCDKIFKLLDENKTKKIALLSYEENKKVFDNFDIEYLSLGKMGDLNVISQNIFTNLRKVDKLNVDFCIVQGVEKEGVGIAIMNRLTWACEYNVINV